jgi:hypothetical protein
VTVICFLPSKPGASLIRSATVTISKRRPRPRGPTPAGYGDIDAGYGGDLHVRNRSIGVINSPVTSITWRA